jgi:SAM-dependent methyltransferase
MRIGHVLGGAISIARDRGIGAVWSWGADRVSVRWFEWRFGIRSEAVIDVDELGLGNPQYRLYAPTDYRSFRRVLDSLRIQPGEDVFVDLGCGMGRALILAATLPFQRVLGVELSADLAATARSNVQRALPRLRCRRVEIVEADATDFAMPLDVTIVYMYNPFCGEALAAVLDKLRESFRQRPRLLRVVCKVPIASQFESDVRRDAWLRLERELVFSPELRYLFFKVEP